MTKLIGKWNVLTKSPMGDNKAVWEFVEKEDGGISGTLTSEGMTTEWESVVVNGDDFELNIKLPLPMGLIAFNMKGTATDSEVTGMSRMKMGKSKFKGKRVG